MQAALYLIRLLIVLVRPHVVSQCAGKSVESETLQAIAECGIASNSKRLLEREHEFDDSAQLRTLRWIEAGEVFIAGEHSVGQAVVAVELLDHASGACAVRV